MPNCIIYTRVSTDEQALNGYSLPHQKSVLEMYAAHRGFSILKHYQEDYSAKDFNRPSFKELFEYVKVNRSTVDFLFITRWDRFSRNVEEAYRIIREFRDLGVEINAVEQPLDFSQPDSKVMLAVYLVIPEVENDKTSIRTKEGLRRAMKEGCYVASAPYGYLNTRNREGKSTLKPDPKLAPLIQAAFKDYATGNWTSEEVRKRYYKKGLKIVKQSMLNILRNPIYIGKISIKAWRKESAIVVDGLHPALIDTDTFNVVQQLLAGKKPKQVHSYSEIDEHLPLRGHLICKTCGRPLTGSASKGRNGKRHFYYHCQPPCKERFKAGIANERFEQLLTEFVITEDAKALYKEVLEETFHGEAKSRKLRVKHIKKELDTQAARMSSLEAKFLDDQIDANTYHSMKQNIETKIAELKAELKSIQSLKKDLEEYLKLGISFLHGVDKLYKNSNAEIKRKITGSIFPENLTFLGKSYRTAFIDELIAAILSKHKGFQLLEIKNPAISGGKSNQAPPLGLEPRTP